MKKLSLIIICLISTLLTSCTTMSDLNKPENSFEGKFLPIGKAIYANDKKEVTHLLTNSEISIDSVGNGGKSGKPTFLMYAILLEKEEMVAILLKLGANPNQRCLLTNQNKTNDSKTGVPLIYHETNPLNRASFSIENIQTAKNICELLINHGADINGWGSYYDAPLKNAVLGHEGENAKAMVKFFLSKGADINAYLDKSGSTILNSISGEWQLVDYLLEEGANPKILDFTGWDFMWEVEDRLSTAPAERRPALEALKSRLVREYGMSYPPIQNKKMGNEIREVEYKKKGWFYDKNGKLIIPEKEVIYDELRGN